MFVKHQKKKEDDMDLKIIAHRGFSDGYPENTLLAFKKAIEADADGIETDLRLSKDGEIVLSHDIDLHRMGNSKVSVESSFLQALKQYVIGENESIATLDELIALAEGRLTLILEVKYNPETYKQLCDILVKKIADKHDWIEVSCFDDRVLLYLHRLDPDIRLHKVIEDASVLQENNFEEKYTYISYFDIAVSLSKMAVKQGLMKKYKVILWTVDDEYISEEKNAGLYGIMVNNISRHIQEKKAMNE